MNRLRRCLPVCLGAGESCKLKRNKWVARTPTFLKVLLWSVFAGKVLVLELQPNIYLKVVILLNTYCLHSVQAYQSIQVLNFIEICDILL